jgi:hypothetical protein
MDYFEHPTKSNSKNPKKVGCSMSNIQNPKLDFCWIIELD